MPVTIVDIARELNLSHTTVSNVVNGKNTLALPEATRQRVLKAAREMGYRPNRAARALSTGRTGMIGLLVYDVYRPYCAHVLHNVQEQIKKFSLELIIYDAGAGSHWLKNRSNTALWPVDGILTFDIAIDRIPWLMDDSFGLPPTVSMGTYYSESTDYVAVDLYACAEAATRQLLNEGRRKVALLQDKSTQNFPADRRSSAYRAVLAEAGMKVRYITAENQSRGASRQAVAAYTTEHEAPDALFCINDDMAIGAYRGLCDAGLDVPGDVALMGCDGIEDTEYLPCPISTIRQPYEQMCELAVGYLQNRIETPDISPQRILLQPELVVRESSMSGRVKKS